MTHKLPKIYLGPMSKEIVDVVCGLSDEGSPIGIVASRRQIESDGGYVNLWSQKSLFKYVKERNSSVILERDHAGPHQGSIEDDGYASLKSDSDNFDIIHIDPWKVSSSVGQAAKLTVDYIRYCLRNADTLFEVGTEESIRKYSPEDLKFFLSIVKESLGSDFEKILYVVIQGGAILRGGYNEGYYNEDNFKDMIKVAKEYGLRSKEHNGDYLEVSVIRRKFDLGLDALNVAPQIAYIQSSILWGLLSESDRNTVFSALLKKDIWRKWFPSNFDATENKEKLFKVCAHYVYSEVSDITGKYSINLDNLLTEQLIDYLNTFK
jgi:hypothetical protein